MISDEMKSRFLVELWSSEGLTGARESTSKVDRSHPQHIRAGCWLGTSISQHLGFCIGQHDYHQKWQLAFSRTRDIRERKAETRLFFRTQPQKSYTVIYTILDQLHRSALFNVGGNYVRQSKLRVQIIRASVILVPILLIFQQNITVSQSFYFLLYVTEYIYKLFSCFILILQPID